MRRGPATVIEVLGISGHYISWNVLYTAPACRLFFISEMGCWKMRSVIQMLSKVLSTVPSYQTFDILLISEELILFNMKLKIRNFILNTCENILAMHHLYVNKILATIPSSPPLYISQCIPPPPPPGLWSNIVKFEIFRFAFILWFGVNVQEYSIWS